MKNHARRAVLILFVAFQCCIARGQSVSGTVNAYYAVTTVNMAVNAVTVTSATGLAPGQRVMLYQAKGAVINTSNTSSYGDISTLNKAGAYEFNTICSVSGNEVWLVYPMLYTYDPTGLVQLVTVPSSAAITVTGTITAAAWDPATGTGGIVALESSGTLTLNADINVSGQGFQGGALNNYPEPPYACSWAATVSDYFYPLATSGAYTAAKKGEGITPVIPNEEYGRGKLANGGGGANGAEDGGAGGGNYGGGGNGGQRAGESFFQCHGPYPGIGGLALASYGYSNGSNRIFFGGGGGAGWENDAVSTPGANGGGIILLSAPTIVGGGGRLLASGSRPMNPVLTDPYQAEGDGGGGGGAGGTIILNATTVSGAITADVTGGAGSNSNNIHVSDCTGPGGGGAGGVVWTAGSVFPAAISAAVSGGANGVVSSVSTKTSCVGLSNGATPGATGASQTGYTLPVSGASLCTTLANSVLLSFTATREDPDVLLGWTLSSSTPAGDISGFVVQRSLDLNHFDSLATVPGTTDQLNYHYSDAAPEIEGPLAYRLAWTDRSGERFYSRVVTVPGRAGPDATSVRLYPNPASGQLTITVISTTAENAVIRVANALGQTLCARPVTLRNGLNSASIPVGSLTPGAYFLLIEAQGKHICKPFVKKEE